MRNFACFFRIIGVLIFSWGVVSCAYAAQGKGGDAGCDFSDEESDDAEIARLRRELLDKLREIVGEIAPEGLGKGQEVAKREQISVPEDATWESELRKTQQLLDFLDGALDVAKDIAKKRDVPTLLPATASTTAMPLEGTEGVVQEIVS